MKTSPWVKSNHQTILIRNMNQGNDTEYNGPTVVVALRGISDRGRSRVDGYLAENLKKKKQTVLSNEDCNEGFGQYPPYGL